MNVNITDNSEKFKQELHDRLPIALEAIGLAAEANAKKEVTSAVYDTDTPESQTYVRTGNLRNSISHATDENSAYVGSNVYYAPYVEMGTSQYPKPRPFIRPAVENYVGEYQELLERYLKE